MRFTQCPSNMISFGCLIEQYRSVNQAIFDLIHCRHGGVITCAIKSTHLCKLNTKITIKPKEAELRNFRSRDFHHHYHHHVSPHHITCHHTLPHHTASHHLTTTPNHTTTSHTTTPHHHHCTVTYLGKRNNC